MAKMLKEIHPYVLYGKVPVSQADNIHWFIAKASGLFPVCYASEDINIVRRVTPVKGYEDKVSSMSSRGFPPHNEAPHRTDAPHALSLHCISEGCSPALFIYNIEDIEKNMSDDLLNFISNEDFIFRPGDSWQESKLGIESRLPIRMAKGMWRFHGFNVYGRNQEQDDAIKQVIKHISSSPCLSINLKREDFILIDNRRTLHAREPFTPDENNVRLLNRVYYREYL